MFTHYGSTSVKTVQVQSKPQQTQLLYIFQVIHICMLGIGTAGHNANELKNSKLLQPYNISFGSCSVLPLV